MCEKDAVIIMVLQSYKGYHKWTWFCDLDAIINIVTQVTANVNNAQNANGGGGGGGQANNGCSYKTFQACGPKEYDGKGGAVALNVDKRMETRDDTMACLENQKMREWDVWNDFMELLVVEFFLVNEWRSWFLIWLTLNVTSLKYIAVLAPKFGDMVKAVQPTTIQSAVLRAGILTDEAISCGTLSKGSEKRQVAPVNAVRMSSNQRACYECRSLDHLKPTCPKLNRAPSQAGNQLAIEGNRGSRNNVNQVRGRVYNVNVNAEEASRDPNVATGTFSLNDYFATILFDSGADFSFISTEFVSMLNVKPRIVNPGYEIEIADGKRVEVNRVVCDCKLELRNSLFDIELIPIGYGSFDVEYVSFG
ncbi:putative reverse transcriptase domain-containing protein [Tanacetum coccineum]